MMSETLKDIENLETVVNLLEDGASDEKRIAMNMIKVLIANKKSQVKSFEDYYEANGFEPGKN